MSGKLFFRVFPGKRGRQSVHVISPLRKINVWMSIHYRTWKNCFSDHCLRWTSDRLQEPHRPVQPGPRSEYSRGPRSWGCSRNGEHWAVSEGWVCKLIGSLLWSQLWFGKLIYWAGLRKPDGDVYVNGFPLCWRRQEGNLEIQKLKDVMGCCCFLFLPFHSVAQVFVFKIICFLSVRAWDGPCFSHTVCVNDPKEVHAWTSLSHGRALDSPMV